MARCIRYPININHPLNDDRNYIYMDFTGLLPVFISGITSCDSSDLDKLPVNENPEVAFVNDDVPQRLSLNNARLKRMISPASNSAYSGKIYEYNDEGSIIQDF